MDPTRRGPQGLRESEAEEPKLWLGLVVRLPLAFEGLGIRPVASRMVSLSSKSGSGFSEPGEPGHRA